MEQIHQCIWKVGNENWDINIPDYTNQDPKYLAETVIKLFLNKESNSSFKKYLDSKNIEELEDYICVQNDKTDDFYTFPTKEIVESIKIHE